MAYNLMIVDDSPSMRGVIRKIIGMSGTDVGQFIEAEHGADALEKLQGNWVDLVITDLYMPVMDGFEFVRRLKQDPMFHDIPVLVVSTESRQARLDEINAMGVAGFIHKPFRPETVRDQIIGCLGVTPDEFNTEDSGDGDF